MSISEKEANDLLSKLIELKNKYNETKSLKDKIILNSHEKLMVDKFKYMVLSKTSQYKKFSNYEDLNQDAYEALVMGLKNFDSSKGSIFWWLHKYIDTRIYRSANAYSTVRIPIAVAKKTPPKIDQIPLNLEDANNSPEYKFIKKINYKWLNEKINELSKEDKDIIENLYGINKDKLSFEEYSKKSGIDKSKINYKLNCALKKLKEISQ